MIKLLHYFIANLLPGLAGYALIPVYATYLSKAEYGLVGKLEVLTYIFSAISLLAVDRSVVRYYFESDDQERRKLILSSIVWLSVFSTIAFGLVTYILINIGWLASPSEKMPLLLLICAVAITNQSLIAGRLMQSRRGSTSFLILQALKGFSTLFFLYFFLAQLSGTIKGYAQGTLAAALLLVPVILWEYHKHISFRLDLKVAVSILKFSAPFVVTLLAAWLFSMHGRLVLESKWGLEALGEFAMSFKIASVMLMVNSAIVLTFTPHFFEIIKRDDGEKTLNHQIRTIHSASFVLFLLFTFIVTDIIRIALPEAYQDIDVYVYALAAAFFISSTMSYCSNLVYLQYKKTALHMVIYVVCGGVAVLLNYFLGLTYGVIGICLSLFVSNFVLYVLHTRVGTSFSKIESLGEVSILLLGVLIFFSGLLGRQISDIGIIFVVFKFAFSAIIFLSAGFFFYKRNPEIARIKT